MQTFFLNVIEFFSSVPNFLHTEKIFSNISKAWSQEYDENKYLFNALEKCPKIVASNKEMDSYRKKKVLYIDAD